MSHLSRRKRNARNHRNTNGLPPVHGRRPQGGLFCRNDRRGAERVDNAIPCAVSPRPRREWPNPPIPQRLPQRRGYPLPRRRSLLAEGRRSRPSRPLHRRRLWPHIVTSSGRSLAAALRGLDTLRNRSYVPAAKTLGGVLIWRYRGIGLTMLSKCLIHDFIEFRFKVSHRLLAPLPFLHVNALKSRKRAPLFAQELVIDGNDHICLRGHTVVKVEEDRLTVSPLQGKIIPVVIPTGCVLKSIASYHSQVKNRDDVINVKAQVSGIGNLERSREWLTCC